MPHASRTASIDYLIVGHVALDSTPQGIRLGGTAAYSALTARALGMSVGLVTSWGQDERLNRLLRHDLQALIIPAQQTTRFENLNTPEGRRQYIHNRAETLSYEFIPKSWRAAPMVHLAPIAQEINPKWGAVFPDAFVAATAQGWLRRWDAAGRVSPAPWDGILPVLRQASLVILSREDVQHDNAVISAMAAEARHLVVTDGASQPVCRYAH